jgi:hypothetical protein
MGTYQSRNVACSIIYCVASTIIAGGQRSASSMSVGFRPKDSVSDPGVCIDDRTSKSNPKAVTDDLESSF